MGRGTEFDQALAALERLDLRPIQRGPKQWVACCPLHDERRPSFGLGEGGLGKALYHCFKCSDATVDDFRAALGIELEEKDTLEERRVDPLPSDADVQRWRSALLTNDKALAGVRRRRGWSLRTLSGYEVGLDGNALVFPQRAVDQSLAQVVRYVPGGGRPDALTGHPRVLWPQPEQFMEDRVLWLVEGEPDALSACELGLRGVSVPGANGWRQGYAERLVGRSVRVCFDCDADGRRSGHRIVGELRALDIDARYIDLDPSRSDKYDLTDFLLEALAEPDGLSQARKWLADVEVEIDRRRVAFNRVVEPAAVGPDTDPPTRGG